MLSLFSVPGSVSFNVQEMSQAARTEVGQFIIDLEDEDCPNSDLHVASFKNDRKLLSELLEKDENRQNIDAKIRPFLSTPLRLAATG